ncbi:MAG: phosphoribosyl-ATP diphosphatase [Alphaproteobacteria bacterium]|nr:phosphoribosyl-ATP diphosphatase [Alphaproteobacteria bacterium]
MPDETLGAAVDKLTATIASRGSASPGDSYTAKLLAGGPEACARKFGEEAIEAIVEAVRGDKERLADEAADVIYHLLVLLAAADTPPAAVASALARRRGMSGLEEKARR